MQFKKDDVRKALLNSGEEAFLKNGFEKASLRKIAKNAGTTIGNFYNYFENKEALFGALVEEDFQKFMFFLTKHNDIERPNYLWEISNPRVWREVLSELIVDMIPEFENGLVLLLDSSTGTRYEQTRTLLVKEIKDHFIEHIEEFGDKEPNNDFADILAHQFVFGFTKILRDYKNAAKRKELLIEHILFFMIGAMGVIGDFK